MMTQPGEVAFGLPACEPPRQPRRMPVWLLLVMLTIPLLGVWAFLAPGYSVSLRRTAFVYTVTMLVFGLCAMAGR